MAFRVKTRIGAVEEQADAVTSPPAAPDALRAMVATLVQDTIRAEFDRFVGAAPYDLEVGTPTPPPLS